MFLSRISLKATPSGPVCWRVPSAGEPTSGIVSIVTTDIEGYSDKFKQWPELMTKALHVHNDVIRRARRQNFGYTLEQEGVRVCIRFARRLFSSGV